MTRPVEDGRCSLFPDVFQLQWPGTANTSRMTKWTFPWVEEKAELLLWGGLCTNHGNTCSDFACCFHQPCINQHMVVLWYVGRRWGVSIDFIWLQFELKPILLLFEHVFSAYVIILLAGVLLFMYQPFGSFPYKWISVAEACRYFQDAQMNSSLGQKKIRTCYSEEDAEPWQHLSRSRVLRCFHQQCINQHMVVLWYVDRRWGVSINCIGLQFELKPILLLFEPNTFLVRMLSFYSQVCWCSCTSHFGSFPYKRIDVKTEERGALYLDESRSGCGQGASIAIMWHCESGDLIVSIKCKRGDVINVYLCGVSITNVA